MKPVSKEIAKKIEEKKSSMKPVSKEIAKKIEEEMSIPFSNLELIIDGHEVVLASRLLKRRLVVVVCVNGEILGRDSHKDSEVGQKFWRPIFAKPLCLKSDKPQLKKFYGPDLAEKLTSRTFAGFVPNFPTPRAFIARINKTCQSVALKAV